jgi:hypothetical protein
MDSQTATTLISGGVALIVALLGIAGAIAAQLVATRRAYANSLALFERQNEAQELARAEEVCREDARRYADQRRSAYAEVLQAADHLASAYSPAVQAARTLQNLRADGADVPARQDAMLALDKVCDRWARLSDALEKAVDDLELLASGEVLEAAKELWAVGTAGDHLPRDLPLSPSTELAAAWIRAELSGYHRRDHPGPGGARAKFVDATRRELGVPPDTGRQLPPAPPEMPP